MKMNKKDVLQLIIMIEDAYNNPFTRNIGFIDPNETKESKIIQLVNNWHEIFKEQSKEAVIKRFQKYVKTNRYPPTIADLYEEPSESRVNHEHLAYMRKLRSGSRD